jgi:hypothetical protein
MRHLIVIALLTWPAPLLAQQPTRTISPGMSRAQVEAALGAPAAMRTSANNESYLYYNNGCARECGMNDLVVLRGDSVVDAIFRSPDRHYTGKSSSPTEFVEVEVTPRKHKAAKKPAPAAKAPAVAAKPAAPAPTAAKPAAAPAKSTTPAATPAKTAAPAPSKIKPPAAGNDTKPSIPAKPETMKPAPAPTTPAPAKKPAT